MWPIMAGVVAIRHFVLEAYVVLAVWVTMTAVMTLLPVLRGPARSVIPTTIMDAPARRPYA